MPEPTNSSDGTLREGYITVNSVAHFYTMIGSGEPFVVLHGGPGMWHDELFPIFRDLELPTVTDQMDGDRSPRSPAYNGCVSLLRY